MASDEAAAISDEEDDYWASLPPSQPPRARSPSPEPPSVLRDFLDAASLGHLLPALGGQSLAFCNASLTASRTTFLHWLKERGITALGHRQAFANALAKARRDGSLPALSTAGLLRTLAQPVGEDRVRIPESVPAQVKPQTPAQLVPRVLFQTYRTRHVSLKAWENVCRVFELNPDWSYEFYDDERCAALIKREFGDDVVRAFARLRAGAAKADLWRYCALYTFGGLYLDMDSGVNRPLSNCIRAHDRLVPMYDAECNLIQWVLIAAPKEPLLKRTVEASTARILAGEPNIFLATGPTVLTDVFYEMHPARSGEAVYGSRTMDWSTKLARLQAAGARDEDTETFSRIYQGYEYADLYEGGEPERYLPTWGRDPTRGLYWDCPQLMGNGAA